MTYYNPYYEPVREPEPEPDPRTENQNPRVFRITLKLANRTVVHETVERWPNDTTEMFNQLCAAVARKFEGTVTDIQEI